jgi:hypothetical protein
VAYLATLLAGQELKVAALLDSDDEGLKAQKQLVNNWLLKASDVLLLGTVLQRPGTVAIEDLFDEAYYLEHAAVAYEKELAGRPLKLPEKLSGSVVDRLAAHFSAAGSAFNKGRVAKHIMADLGTKELKDLSAPTLDAFRKAIAAVNVVVARWAM